MNRYQETFKIWNKVAQLYQDKFMDLDIYNGSYDAFCEGITKQNPAILELGCGPGNITKYLSNKRPDFQIEALDVAPEMIRLAQQNVPQAYFKVMDVREIGQLPHQYDGIVCGFCIPYLSVADLNQLLSNCSKLLVDDGIFYLSFVAGNPDDSGYQIGSSGDRMYFYYHRLEHVVEEIKNQQFKILNQIEVAYQNSQTHTIIIARKMGL